MSGTITYHHVTNLDHPVISLKKNTKISDHAVPTTCTNTMACLLWSERLWDCETKTVGKKTGFKCCIIKSWFPQLPHFGLSI
jgi:hypothetical protein